MKNKFLLLLIISYFLINTSILISSNVLASEVLAEKTGQAGQFLKSEDMAEYELMVVAKQPGELVAVYNTLNAPVDEESLILLGDYCYDEVDGGTYSKVFISWFLPDQPKGDKPWAVTNYSGKNKFVEILDESLADKYPSIKHWNQKGHKPIR